MMTELDKKTVLHFQGLTVRKDLIKTINENVPNEMLEYLLGQRCVTGDEASIQTGIKNVKGIVRKHYVNKKEAILMRSKIKENGISWVIDKITVSLNEKENAYEAKFANLDIKNVEVSSGTVNEHPILLTNGAYCIAYLAYVPKPAKKGRHWILTASLELLQPSGSDLDAHNEARKHFSSDEWIDVIMHTIGYKPAMFTYRNKLLQVVRFIPYCERNYNQIELGPKSTAKSHTHSALSHHGTLLSGGEATVPVLFVNLANGKIGLVCHRDVVIFDEFSGKNKQVDKRLVDFMKNYTANQNFCRGNETVEADASMVFIGNTQKNVSSTQQHSDSYEDLPANFRDPAILDRIHCNIPGCEMNVICEDMLSESYGLMVGHLAEILHSMRACDYSDRFKKYFMLSSDISKRDEDAIKKTFSGLMKILHPDGNASKEEIEELLDIAIECRKHVKDYLMRIDDTFPKVTFSYKDKKTGKVKFVSTLEEGKSFHSRLNMAANGTGVPEDFSIVTSKQPLRERSNFIFQTERNVTFDRMLGPYLHGASKITVTDPYVHRPHQVQNLMELLGTVVKCKPRKMQVTVHLTTTEDKRGVVLQRNHFEEIKDCFAKVGVDFTWDFDDSTVTRDRDIVTDHGWKILLSRGLDVFRLLEENDTRPFTSYLQRNRACEQFEVMYLKNDGSSQLQKFLSQK